MSSSDCMTRLYGIKSNCLSSNPYPNLGCRSCMSCENSQMPWQQQRQNTQFKGNSRISNDFPYRTVRSTKSVNTRFTYKIVLGVKIPYDSLTQALHTACIGENLQAKYTYLETWVKHLPWKPQVCSLAPFGIVPRGTTYMAPGAKRILEDHGRKGHLQPASEK